MDFKKRVVGYLLVSVSIALISCKKGKKLDLSPDPIKDPKYVAVVKSVVYRIKGTHFRLNFIDSTGNFQRDRLYSDSLVYRFKKGSGASIGISVFKQDIADAIQFWEISINGKVKANSEGGTGGAYFTVPYN